jgi:DNA-binding PadR family transcriptional regulator
MKGEHLGELEELILLMVAALFDEAYGVAIQDALKSQCNRNLSISSVHSVLVRLGEKGMVNSRYGGITENRGGRRKLLFTVSVAGQKALVDSRQMRNQLWDSIPRWAFR